MCVVRDIETLVVVVLCLPWNPEILGTKNNGKDIVVGILHLQPSPSCR